MIEQLNKHYYYMTESLIFCFLNFFYYKYTAIKYGIAACLSIMYKYTDNKDGIAACLSIKIR